MKLRISRWGNSLAVRLPADYTRAAGIKEGDSLAAEISPAGKITLMPDQVFDKSAFLKKIQKLRASMPMTSPTADSARSEERY